MDEIRPSPFGAQEGAAEITWISRVAHESIVRQICLPIGDARASSGRTAFTELVTMEDFGFSKPGGALGDILDGRFDSAGDLPCQIDGGLECFGHPIGASGLRMACKVYIQLLGRAGERQIPGMRLGRTHNLADTPITALPVS